MGSIRDVEAEILTAWRAFLSRGGRLPKTNDGKVNVSRLATALGISTNDAQYFYKKDAVRTTINEEALRQGLLPVGARNDELDEIRLLGLVKGLPPLIVYFYGGRVSRELDATIGNDLMSAWEITGHRAPQVRQQNA